MEEKVIPIHSSSVTADDELWMASRVLNEALQQIADTSPRLRALGWIVDGTPGSLSTMGEINNKYGQNVKPAIIMPNTRERVEALAYAICTLPKMLVDEFTKAFVEARARKGAQ